MAAVGLRNEKYFIETERTEWNFMIIIWHNEARGGEGQKEAAGNRRQ
jgi:hypothetical protein